MTEATTDMETIPESKITIESLDDLKRVLTIAKGGDPDAIQAITKFMDFESEEERSYFPDKILTLCVGQLQGYGRLFYPTNDSNPFSLVGRALSIAFMGFRGFKSNQFVEMTRQTPNLDALTTTPEEARKGILSGLFNRGSRE